MPDEGVGKAADLALAIVKAEAIPHFGLIAGQIGGRQYPGIGGMLAYLGHHGIRQRPPIEGIRPLCSQSAQHLGQRRVGQPGARRFGAAIRLIEVGSRLRIPCQIGILGQQCGQPWTYHKSLFCQRDGGLEQRSPG